MATKRDKPTEKEAARVAVSKAKPEPCCYGKNGCCLDEAKAALQKARTLEDILAVVYGLKPADRARLAEDVAEARSRILGGK
jgi:hypothetical protein